MTQTLRPNRLGHIKRNKVYRFTNDHDSVLIQITELIMDSGFDTGEIIERILDVSNGQVHMSYRTIENWLSGKTKRPQNYTVDWVARALGYERPFVRRPLRAAK